MFQSNGGGGEVESNHRGILDLQPPQRLEILPLTSYGFKSQSFTLFFKVFLFKCLVVVLSPYPPLPPLRPLLLTSDRNDFWSWKIGTSRREQSDIAGTSNDEINNSLTKRGQGGVVWRTPETALWALTMLHTVSIVAVWRICLIKKKKKTMTKIELYFFFQPLKSIDCYKLFSTSNRLEIFCVLG